ncbi:MAG: hypothetical protein MUD00_03150 [Candidatus Pacebacteria bacterium]|jgi:hypothetical protein|nr:hypothetical protein [Candidatus Paceibacterota bacterium]
MDKSDFEPIAILFVGNDSRVPPACEKIIIDAISNMSDIEPLVFGTVSELDEWIGQSVHTSRSIILSSSINSADGMQVISMHVAERVATIFVVNIAGEQQIIREAEKNKKVTILSFTPGMVYHTLATDIINAITQKNAQPANR